MKYAIIFALIIANVLVLATVTTAAPKDAPPVCNDFIAPAQDYAVGMYQAGWAYGYAQALDGVIAPPMDAPYHWMWGYGQGVAHVQTEH